MPFTLSHTVLAPPLQSAARRFRISLPLSALVIGTMAPDFEYLPRLRPGGGVWHSPVGLVEFCVPVGVAVWWIFRTVISPSLLKLLPPGLGDAAAARIAPGPAWRLVPGVALAVLIGAASHDLWDSFTHAARWGVRQLPALNGSYALAGGRNVPAHVILQDLSTAVGLLVIGILMWRWVMAQPKEARVIPRGERAWRLRDQSLLLLTGLVGGVLNASRQHRPGLAAALGLAAVGGMAALAVAVGVYALVDRLRNLRGTVA